MAIAVLALASATVVQRAESADPLQAQYRGCKTGGWCAFRIESLDPLAASVYRVYPHGIARTPDDAARSVAVRDRLNALLASMVHQHKRIVLHDFRQVGDDAYSAIVTVNGANVAADPIVRELQGLVSPAVSPDNTLQ